MEFLAVSYLVMLLRAAFLGGDHKEEGTLVEVGRNGRNAMVAGGIARDATDEEIAKFRGGSSGGVTDDPDLPAAQAELSSLEAQSKTLEGEVLALGVTKGQLAEEVGQLQSSKQELTGELEALEQGKAKLVEEVAELEKAKKAAAKAGK
jgi:hypothetical protein